MRQAELKPNIPASLFPPTRPEPTNRSDSTRPTMNTSRRRSNDASKLPTPSKVSDEFSDDVLDDGDFLAAGRFLYPMIYTPCIGVDGEIQQRVWSLSQSKCSKILGTKEKRSLLRPWHGTEPMIVWILAKA
jgi:hypothetical protein